MQNGVFVVNASIDLSNSECDDIYISVFDNVVGSIVNVSVLGSIDIVGLSSNTNINNIY